jgi:hypothetical protein
LFWFDFNYFNLRDLLLARLQMLLQKVIAPAMKRYFCGCCLWPLAGEISKLESCCTTIKALSIS